MADYQLAVTLSILFFYSDGGLYFKHTTTIPHKMTRGLVSVQGWLLIAGKNNKERQI